MLLKSLACMALLAQAGNIYASEDNVDYDHTVDFSKFHTFQMADTSKGALAQANQLMDQRVHEMVVQHMTALGMKEVTDSPDLMVTYDASTKQNHVLNTFGAPMGPVGFGMGVGWRRWGGMGGMATTTVSTFTDGTLVIDAYTPPDNKMVWRGIAEAAVSDNPEKTTKNIEKSMDKLFEKWQKILNKEEK
jgi:hypothetical protein